MNNKPNFFILGAAHAGTTSFNNYLKSNPEVFASSIKEPNFFTKLLISISGFLLSDILDTTHYSFTNVFVCKCC